MRPILNYMSMFEKIDFYPGGFSPFFKGNFVKILLKKCLNQRMFSCLGGRSSIYLNLPPAHDTCQVH